MAIRSASGVGALSAQSRSSKQVPSPTQLWWVIGESVALETETVTNYDVYGPHTQAQADAKVKAIAQFTQSPGDVSLSGPFSTRQDALAAIRSGKGLTAPKTKAHLETGSPTSGGGGWLSSIGAMIASGIEQGIVSILKDLWVVIEGPVLILAGVLIAVVALGIYFRNDISAAVTMLPK